MLGRDLPVRLVAQKCFVRQWLQSHNQLYLKPSKLCLAQVVPVLAMLLMMTLPAFFEKRSQNSEY